jgi:hypothetical protein
MDDEQNAGNAIAHLRRPAVDPATRRRVRRSLNATQATERLAAATSGAVGGSTAAGLIAVGGAMPWAIGVLIFQGPADWQSAAARWALLLALAIAAVSALVYGAGLVRFGQVGSGPALGRAGRARSASYLSAGDFDVQARTLLRRAQDAIDAVMSSDVCQAGVLDQAAYRTTLAAQEWDIALALHEQAKLRQARAKLPSIADDCAARELLAQQHEAGELADRSVTSRVAALEQLAAEVRRADTAYRGWRDHAVVAELADPHLDMLARTAADSYAVADIKAMSRQARILWTTFHDSAS